MVTGLVNKWFIVVSVSLLTIGAATIWLLFHGVAKCTRKPKGGPGTTTKQADRLFGLWEDPRRAIWAGFGGALWLTSAAIAASVCIDGRNGVTVNRQHQLVPVGMSLLTNVFLIVLCILVFIGVYILTAALAHQNYLPLPGVTKAENRRRDSPLDITFDQSGDSLCIQDRRAQSEKDFALRLRVSNTGPIGVQGVRLRLIRRDPGPGYTHYLTIMHDHPYQVSAILGERCPPDPKRYVYFDLAYRNLLHQSSVFFSYASEYLAEEQERNPNRAQTYDVTVEADGYWEDNHSSVRPTRCSFRMECKDDGSITLILPVGRLPIRTDK
jgi:hypothetical protein